MRFLAPIYAVLVVAAVVLRVRFVVALVVALGLIAVSAWMQVRAGSIGIHLGRSVPQRAFHGERIDVTVHAQNRSRWPQAIVEIRDTVPYALGLDSVTPTSFVTSLRSRGTETMTYSLVCRRRGYHRVGPMAGVVRDTFGLESRPLIGPANDRVIVYPEIVPLQQLGLPARGPLPDLVHPWALIEDPNRFSGVRSYETGDDARRIEWAASARTSELLARQFDVARSRETMICVDLDRNSYERGRWGSSTELAVTAAASMAHHILTRERLSCGLYVHGIDSLAVDESPPFVPVGSGHGHLMAHLEVLARVAVTPDGGFVTGLEELAVRLPFGATVVVVSGGLTNELRAALNRLRRRGHVPAVVLVAPGSPSPNRVDGIQVFAVTGRAEIGALA